MSVDRRIVEVGAELADRVLRVLAHEDLATESDHRLVGRAVSVVLEALAVQLDQAHVVLLRPEDVVREEPVAVESGLLCDLRAPDAAVPHERRNAVEGARRRLEALQRSAELAFPVHEVLTPQPVHQVVVLERQFDALADVLAEPRIDRARVAAPHHHIHPAVGHVLQHREVFSDLDGVVRGDEGRGGRQDDPVGLRGDVAEHGRRAGRDERRVVVLALGENVEADLFRLLGDGQHGLDALVFRGRLAGGRVRCDVADGEDSELHSGCSNSMRLHGYLKP